MLNSGTMSLDHVLCLGRTSKGREGLGYKKGSSGTTAGVQTNAQAKLSGSKNVV